MKYLFIRVAIDWVHHFLSLSLSLTYITSPYFVSFRFALRSSPLCSRPPDVYVYVSSTQFIARCRSARACYRYSQCLSLCKRGGRITFSSHVPSCCSRIDSAVPWLYSYFSFPGITVGSRKSTHTYNDDDRLLRRDRFPIRPNSNRLIVPSRDGAAEASHFCFIN